MTEATGQAGSADHHFPCLAIHIMTPGVIQIPGDVSIGEAARLMHKEQVPCLLIKDTDTTIGIVTDSDIVRKVIAQGLNPYDVQSRRVMSMPVLFIEFDEPVERVSTTLMSAGVPLLIVTRNHQPIGFVTARDLISPPKRRELPIQASVKVYNERPEGVTYPAVISRLGHAGGFLETEAPMQPGARVTVEFCLPGSRRPIAAEGEVIEPSSENTVPPTGATDPAPTVAMKFTDVRAVDQADISSWIIRTRRSSDLP